MKIKENLDVVINGRGDKQDGVICGTGLCIYGVISGRGDLYRGDRKRGDPQPGCKIAAPLKNWSCIKP